MPRRPVPSLGVYQFGRAASFRIWMSNAWLAASFLRRAFSFSRAFIVQRQRLWHKGECVNAKGFSPAETRAAVLEPAVPDLACLRPAELIGQVVVAHLLDSDAIFR